MLASMQELKRLIGNRKCRKRLTITMVWSQQ
jgi:hypothetical protein